MEPNQQKDSFRKALRNALDRKERTEQVQKSIEVLESFASAIAEETGLRAFVSVGSNEPENNEWWLYVGVPKQECELILISRVTWGGIRSISKFDGHSKVDLFEKEEAFASWLASRFENEGFMTLIKRLMREKASSEAP